MAPTVASKPNRTKPPRVLVVDDETDLQQLIADVVSGSMDCKTSTACNLREARKLLESETFDLVMIDLKLPDGDGMTLLPTLRQRQPQAGAIVITGEPSVTGAISAMRAGVIDFLPKPFSAAHLLERVNKALQRQTAAVKVEKRLVRLREAVRRLNISRRMVTKKVDLLCNDLVSAYGELSRQLDDVRNQEAFRKLMNDAKDLEQMLCHAMDWLLRHAGYANVAIWLAADDQDHQLGAYMKYTIAGEQALTESMKQGLVRLVNREGLMHASGSELRDQLTEVELQYLSEQTVMGVSCTYLGEALATVIMFRDQKCPFSADDTSLLKAIAPIFATSLASIVRDPDQEDLDDEDGPTLDEDEEQRRKQRERHDADWWKRGEAPPF
jgi:DNA-binding response OmpR family regulator